MDNATVITEFRRFSTTEPSENTSPSKNPCGYESCNGWWILSDGMARPCMTCRRRRLFEAVPVRFRIRLEDLRPTELLLGRVSMEQQSRLLELIRNQLHGNFLLMGRSGCGKTQLLHSMYLNEAESSRYGATLLIADTRDVISDLRDFEFDAERTRPPMLSPSMIRSCARSGKRLAIFLDEFHKGGTHTDWAIGVIHDLVDTIYQVRDTGNVRFCAATSLLRDEFIAQLGGSLYRRMEDICAVVEVGDSYGLPENRENHRCT